MHNKHVHCALVFILLATIAAYAEKPAAPTQRELILFYERQLAESEKRGNWEAIARRLAPDFMEIGADGKLYNTQQVRDYFPDLKLHSYKLSEWEFRSLGPNAALVAYRSDVDASFKGRRLAGAFRVSSIWVRQDGAWKLKFHQATSFPNKPPASSSNR